MAAIRIQTEVGSDRKLVVQLPDSVQPGSVDLVIYTAEASASVLNPAREAAKAKLSAAGALVTQFTVPADAARLTVAQRLQLGSLAPDAPSSLDLINEDRGGW